MKKSLCCAVLSAPVVIILLVAGVMAASAPQTIPVGVVVSLSGFDSNNGTQGKAGFELAAEDINRTGGVYVKQYNKKIPLELIIQDMESDRNKAISRMEWLYTSKKVVAYVGMTLINAGQGVAEKNRVPAIVLASPVQAAHDRGLRYWFSPVGKSPDLARVMFDLLDSVPEKERPKTAAIFQENSEYGVEQAEYFKKEAASRGCKVVAFEKYSPMSKDLSPLILAAKNAGAEALLTNPVTPDAMLMMRQMKELDYNPKALVVIRGANDLSWGKAMGPMGDYAVITSFWHHGVKYPGVDKLNAAHRAKFGRPADIETGNAYASIQILADAIERAGTLDTTRLRDAIAATDVMTVIGKVRFNANGTALSPCPALMQWVGGQQKLIWPKEFRESSYVYPMPPWTNR